MSQQWHNFTKGTLRIEKVLISVPGKFKKCLMHKNTVPFEDQNEESADIQVVPSGVLTSTQYGPCGTRGKSIQLPLSNLNETDDDYKDGSSSTNLLLRTWINSNYGVFLESLHPDIWHSNESTTVSQNFQKMLHNICIGGNTKCEKLHYLIFTFWCYYLNKNFTNALCFIFRGYLKTANKSFYVTENRSEKLCNCCTPRKIFLYLMMIFFNVHYSLIKSSRKKELMS